MIAGQGGSTRADRPRVTLHFAQSLDGRIATRTGSARWISGPEATRFAHELRAAAGAVVVGSGTALADDPQLTVRLCEGPQPIRVVLDGRGRLPATARLFTDAAAPTVHATRAPARPPAGSHVEAWALPAGAEGQGIDLHALLARLADRGVESVLVEGGRLVLTAFLRARLVDRLVITLAPMILGAGVDAVGDLGVDRIADARRFVMERLFRLGDDVMIDLVPRRDTPGSAVP
jgi:riboflavin-specific deaminase-like protein